MHPHFLQANEVGPMSENQLKVLACTVGMEQYGVELKQLSSIEKPEGIARVPNVPSIIRGVVLVRGELVPVIDLKGLDQQENTEITAYTRLLVCKKDEGDMALLVDQASDIVDIVEESINAGISTSGKEYRTGMVETAIGLMTLIETKKLAEQVELIHSDLEKANLTK